MMAGPWDYVKAFNKNCPTVHLSQDDEEELRRLFWSAMEHVKTKLATSDKKSETRTIDLSRGNIGRGARGATDAGLKPPMKTSVQKP